MTIYDELILSLKQFTKDNPINKEEYCNIPVPSWNRGRSWTKEERLKTSEATKEAMKDVKLRQRLKEKAKKRANTVEGLKHLKSIAHLGWTGRDKNYRHSAEAIEKMKKSHKNRKKVVCACGCGKSIDISNWTRWHKPRYGAPNCEKS